MKNPIQKFYEFLDRPLFPWGRVLLALAVVPLVLAFTAPLWRISLIAPQYPDGLWVDIFAYTVEGGNHGQHLPKIIKTSTKNSRVKTKKTLIVIKIKQIEQPFFKHKSYKPKIT